jgi:hypothetical protein
MTCDSGVSDRQILLIEDYPDGVDLTLRALKRAKTADEIRVARDGEAVVFLSRPENHNTPPGLDLLDSNFDRNGSNAYVRKPVRFSEFADAVVTLSMFWLLLNQQLPHISEPAT